MQTTNDLLPGCDARESMGAIDHDRAPALGKSLDILELLAERKEGLTHTEITQELGRNASEIYRMLERLVARRYVMRSSGGDRYMLSLKLFALAHRRAPMDQLIAEALPLMQRFAEAAEQSCYLTVYDRGNLRVIAQVDGSGPYCVSVRLGSRIGLIDTASGHVTLAFQTSDQRARMVSAHRKVNGHASLNDQELAQACQTIRRSGFLCQESRQLFGVTDLSTPILGPSGNAFAVLTCPYVQRIDERGTPTIDAVTERLRTIATSLSMYRANAN